jgi:hypothetical protein
MGCIYTRIWKHVQEVGRLSSLLDGQGMQCRMLIVEYTNVSLLGKI